MVAAYIFLLVPEYLLRFVAWIASRFIYRFDVKGDLNIPTEGAAGGISVSLIAKEGKGVLARFGRVEIGNLIR